MVRSSLRGTRALSEGRLGGAANAGLFGEVDASLVGGEDSVQAGDASDPNGVDWMLSTRAAARPSHGAAKKKPGGDPDAASAVHVFGPHRTFKHPPK
eukprot:TRINITY_DN48667_c0_g1_i1.p2 TRINITY_DN48667_c0_g1~~TRINITY_DN48667_c0_g1_i1.p2  ORF type:complete len:114 (+),score=41.13 TRINITY_DN48667_c0_g1_i1:52-342(+)